VSGAERLLATRVCLVIDLVIGLIIGLSSPAAHAEEGDGVAACLHHHIQGQELRRDGKLLQSREAFRHCSVSTCPSQIIRDCLDWSGELARQVPSVSFRISADGLMREDARVSIDGALVDRTTGKATELDPGTHSLKVVLPRFPTRETQLVVNEGDQFRIIDVTFTTPPPPAIQSRAAVEMHRPFPVAAYVFSGLAVASAISGGAWALSSWSLRSELEEGCGRSCPPPSVDVLRRRALLADISWGVGAASVILAGTFYALRPEKPVDESIEIDVGLLPRGGAIGSISVSAF
jgi:PEGA domain-containing protein